MKRMLVAAVSLVPCLAAAQMAEDENSFNLRLQPFEPSYAVYRSAKGDERTITAHYSFRYLFSDEVLNSKTACGLQFWLCDDEFFFSYTGEFDFYWGERPSSPVVNRLNNPALHWRWVYRRGTWVDIGVEHRSNGQSLDVKDPEVASQARAAYARGDHEFFDRVSRSANYLSLSAARRSDGATADRGHAFQGGVKFYASSGEEADVVWGPPAGRSTRFSDYDRLRLNWRYWWGGNKEFGIESILGDRGLSTNSWNVDATWHIARSAAIYVRVHSGPMLTLSNYTQSQRAIGVGLKLVPYIQSNAALLK